MEQSKKDSSGDEPSTVSGEEKKNEEDPLAKLIGQQSSGGIAYPLAALTMAETLLRSTSPLRKIHLIHSKHSRSKQGEGSPDPLLALLNQDMKDSDDEGEASNPFAGLELGMGKCTRETGGVGDNPLANLMQ